MQTLTAFILKNSSLSAILHIIPTQLEQIPSDTLLTLALWQHRISENRVVYYYVGPEKERELMPYESVDALQRALTRDVFHYAKDAKKAAGRALGTLVEIITFYLIKSWGYERHTAIERRLPEYANPDITHNVEFSLHPSAEIAKSELPLTPKKILKLLDSPDWTAEDAKSTQLLSSDEILRNSLPISAKPQRTPIAFPSTNSLSIPSPFLSASVLGLKKASRKAHRRSRKRSREPTLPEQYHLSRRLE